MGFWTAFMLMLNQKSKANNPTIKSKIFILFNWLKNFKLKFPISYPAPKKKH